jgi:hypothetical protein
MDNKSKSRSLFRVPANQDRQRETTEKVSSQSKLLGFFEEIVDGG